MSKAVKYFFLAIAGMIAIYLGLTAVNIATTPARIANETFNAKNVIFNYERFYDLNAAYDSRAAQIAQYKSDVSNETNPTEKIRLRTELSAMSQSCRETVTTYNNDSQKLNREIFKANQLPVTLDIATCS